MVQYPTKKYDSMMIAAVASYFRTRFNLCFRSMLYNEKKTKRMIARVSVNKRRKNICARGHQTHNLL